ncbi:MAG: hypothetical protein DI629_16495 [Mesorhizobium amorphae]|nr:MAG: hypothetical protein DI629_16495 [Mesorhizobium amorphae]
MEAALTALARLHGAFILGFDEGVELIRRADEFAMTREQIELVSAPGNELILSLSTSNELVDVETQRLHRPVADYLIEYGWHTSRMAFTAYRIVENATIAMLKFTLGNDWKSGGVLTAYGTLLAVAPEFGFAAAAKPFILANAQNFLVFFSHSPEMRQYLEWAIELLREDAGTFELAAKLHIPPDRRGG